jgi:colanic acid/amylovoran biosynthesis glycosyltransferase
MRIGYVLNFFPKLSESFILNEISELLINAVDIQVLSVSSAEENILHDKYGYGNFTQRSYYFDKNMKTSDLLRRSDLKYLLKRPIFQNPLTKLRHGIITTQFTEISKGLNIDMLHSHFASDAATVAMSLSEELGIPFTFTAHAYDLYRETKTLKWFAKKEFLLNLCSKASGIVAISNYNRDFLIRIGVNESKINVVHCGVDPDEFRRTTPFKVSNQILCVARLIEKKGLKYLLEAMGYLSDDLRVKLLIVGTGPEEQILKDLADQPKLKARIQFLGDVHDVDLLELYEKSALFVLPCVISSDGDRDGIPVALMEAMSMEIPVISTSISGIPELVKDGENGLLVKPNDSRSLAFAIEKLLREPETCEKLGKEGRQTIQEKFNIKKSSLALKGIFEFYQ